MLSTNSDEFGEQKKKTGGMRPVFEGTFVTSSGLFSHRLVEATLGRVDLTSLLEFSASLGNFLGIHAKGLGDIAGTDGLTSFLHCVEDLIFHGVLLMCGV